MPRTAVGLLLAVLLAHTASAQQRLLTLDDIYGPGAGARINGKAAASLAGIAWVDQAHYLWPGEDAATWMKVEALSGRSEPLFDQAKLVTALSRLPGVAAEDARLAARRRPANFNAKHDGFLLTIGDDLYYYDIPKAAAARLTESGLVKEEATFSPDGQSVAFVSNNNLYVTSVSAPAVRALTTDGHAELLNGKLDWVYSEELYGRGNYRAYWWSPDSSHIAFLQSDEKAVPTYTLIDEVPYHPAFETFKYPKAGDPNPLVRLGIVAVNGAGQGAPEARWVDTSRYNEFLVVNVGWMPHSQSVVYQVQDRKQTWLDFNAADRATGRTTTLFKETSKTWVERWQDSGADPFWLKDGSFLWLSERTGWRHLYHYRADGSLVRQVTNGDWEVRSVHAVDAAGEWVYFSGTERTAISSDAYRVRLDGAGMQRLTSAPGNHDTLFNPGGSLYLDSWSDATTPNQVRLHRSNGNELRVVEANPVPSLGDYKLSKPEFVQVKTRDGFVMEAMMIKPPDFDPSKRYPVYQYLYGGPHSQVVRNVWRRSEYMYEQLLAQRGIIVWLCDNRTASGKGAVSVWPLYKNLGELELRDIEDCASWLKQQPYVDSSRMGLYGYSYGGYLAAYALTRPSSFSMGIAGGPVSDWRDYDTIYTERYLGLPRENPEGYRKSSPRFNAADLHGELLLIHGALDDNVHPQNTMQFAHELQRAGKSFQMMLYPQGGHGNPDPQLYRHEKQLMLDFTLKALRP